MWWIILLISLFLLLCAMPLFPVLTSFFFRSGDTGSEEPAETPVTRVDILIPCHNEHGALKKTLLSLQTATSEARRIFPDVKFGILVGLDDCHDKSMEDTADFSARVLSYSHRCKWLVLDELSRQSDADWLAFVDAGTVWDPRLLRNALPYFSDPQLVCLSPAYWHENGGIFSRLFWKIEALLKALENRSGGPVSVHGCTVFYRRTALLKAFTLLHGRRWINDDVVIPLTLRMIFPEQKNLYCQNRCAGFSVCDSTPSHAGREKIARERIAQGNLQWLRSLLPISMALNPMTVIYALRRIFRLTWALIPASLSLGAVCFAFEKLIDGQERPLWSFILSLIVIAQLSLLRSYAFCASLRAVLSLFRNQSSPQEEVRWS